MEKIFRDFRVDVIDDGFSDRIMSGIMPFVDVPSPNTYRIPTIAASICTVLIIIITTVSIGLGTMNDTYEQVVASMQSYTYEKYAKIDKEQDNIFESLE